jgi:hypothetical protein
MKSMVNFYIQGFLQVFARDRITQIENESNGYVLHARFRASFCLDHVTFLSFEINIAQPKYSVTTFPNITLYNFFISKLNFFGLKSMKNTP